MSWLSGKPTRILSLSWPTEQDYSNKRYHPPGSFSILDDQVLYAFVHKQSPPSTSVYLAKIYEAVSNQDDEVRFQIVANLPYTIHRAALLPNRVGFTSLTFNKAGANITMRIHQWDGTVLMEQCTHATAAYGQLVVEGDLIGICVSSGQDPPDDMYLDGFPAKANRVDYFLTSEADHDAPTGDQIVVWNWKGDNLTTVSIPQDDFAPLGHQASFCFINQSCIALGGTLSSAFGTPSALLKTFEISGNSIRTFAHSENFEMDDDLGVVAQKGSSDLNQILVNYHHRGSRITVVKNNLLDGTIESKPASDDPSGLHTFSSHPIHARTIEGTINQWLPSVCKNRLLLIIHSEDKEALERYVTGKYRKIVLFLCDFDQERCARLLDTSIIDRWALEKTLKEENEYAQVEIVHRNYQVSIEDEIDMEYPAYQSPEDWRNHMQDLYNIRASREQGESTTPTLEFDEGPPDTKEIPRVLFTRSIVRLPDDGEFKSMELSELALSSCGIIHVPQPGQKGHVFVFTE